MILRLFPDYSTYNLDIIVEAPYFDNIEFEAVTSFKKAFLNLQNIDDRFIIEWNNIRFINTKEKGVHDFVLLKDNSMVTSRDPGNLVTVNINPNGVSILGSNIQSSTSKEGNYDKTISQLEVNNTGKQTVFIKDLPISNMASIENNFLTSLKKRTTEDDLYSSFRSVNKESINLLNEKLDKYLNDPVVMKMEKELFENNMLDELVKDKPFYSFKEKQITHSLSHKDAFEHENRTKFIGLFIFLTAAVFFFIQSDSIVEAYMMKLVKVLKIKPTQETNEIILEVDNKQTDSFDYSRVKFKFVFYFTLIKFILSLLIVFLLNNVLRQYNIPYGEIILTICYIPILIYLSYRVVLDFENLNLNEYLK
jgi:hypothetical protein